jgi:RIMS-binding protein 2
MPVLSLHNTYSLPTGSASYSLGLSGAPAVSSYSYPLVGTGGISSVLCPGGGVSSLIGTGLTGTGTGLGGLSSTNPLANLGGYHQPSSYSTYTNPLLASGAMKMKPLDDLDLIGRYGNRGGTPCSPIPPVNWGLDSYAGIDGVNPAFMHHSQTRPLSRIGLDLDGEYGHRRFSPFFAFLVEFGC